MATWFDVLHAALALPGVEESTSYRMPCAKVRGKTFLNMSPHEAGALVLRCPVDEAELLLAARPDLYFLTPHYEGYGCVLARLDAIDADELTGRVEDAYGYVVDKYRLKLG